MAYILYQGDPPLATVLREGDNPPIRWIASSDTLNTPIHHIAKIGDGGKLTDATKELCLAYLDQWCEKRSILEEADNLPDLVRGLCEAEIAERQQNVRDDIRHEKTERTW